MAAMTPRHVVLMVTALNTTPYLAARRRGGLRILNRHQLIWQAATGRGVIGIDVGIA